MDDLKAKITALAVSEIEYLIGFMIDLIDFKKNPSQTPFARTSLYQELHGCRSKRLYRSLRAANKALTKYKAKYKVPMRVYECPTCGNWHITTKM